MDTESFILHVKTDEIYRYMQQMLKQDLTHQIFNQTEHYLKEKIKKGLD